MKNLKFGFLLTIFIALSTVDCQRWNSNGSKLSRSGSYYSDKADGSKTPEANGIPKMESSAYLICRHLCQAVKLPSRGGIGAWGYVSIILFVILTGLGVYYTIIFYPIVCKKQRMYNVMGSTTV